MRIPFMAAARPIKQSGRAAGRYFRLYVDSNNLGGFTEVGELEFLNQAGQDLFDIVPPVATHSSAYSGGTSAMHAIDNNMTTRWAGNTNNNEWMKFVFPEAVEVFGITVRSLGLGMEAYTDRAIRDFRLEVSSNGIDWVTVKAWTNQTGWTPAEKRTYML
ncbi:F5/8 type C domain protein [compost metagenome]